MRRPFLHSILHTSCMLILASLFLFPTHTYASDELDVRWEDDPLFTIENAYPGKSTSQNVRVQNDHRTEAADLYIKIPLDSGKSLAKELKFYVIDKSSGRFLIGGPGDRYNMNKLSKEGRVFIERLEPGESNRYKIKIKFDKHAGNELQGVLSQFDIKFRLISEIAQPGSIAPQRSGVPIGGVIGGEDDAGDILGVEDETLPEVPTINHEEHSTKVNDPQVAGVETTCSSWSLWSWFILLSVSTLLFNIKKVSPNTFIKTHYQFIQITSTIASLAVWYFFDACRSYTWVPLALAAIILISTLLQKRRIR